MRLLALALVLLAAPALANGEDEVGIGLPAPGFSLRTLNPQAAGTAWFRLDQFAGEDPDDPGSRLVLLSFFASWCGPCTKELPFLVQLDRMYRDRGLRVVSISVDRDEAGIEAVRKLVKEAKVTHPVLSDRFNVLARRYLGEQSPLPSLFLVARDGTLIAIERGYAREASTFLLAEVQSALGLTAQRKAATVKPAAATRP
jgi:thiol-disulfide isomerase/thioredoxin